MRDPPEKAGDESCPRSRELVAAISIQPTGAFASREIVMRLPFHAAAFAIAFALAASISPSPADAQGKPVIVFAAASLKGALDEAAAVWTAKSGVEVKTSYAASPALAKQIEEGAPADLFISADLDWMDYVDKKNLMKAGTRGNLLGNSIVLVASKDWTKGAIKIEPNFPLATLLGDGRLAMAGVVSVPAGKYGKAALEKLGVWNSVANKLAESENVRAALVLVARGEAPLGIVYRTDAAAEPSVKIIGTFPEDSHPPIVYPVAALASSKNTKAEDFLRYLAGPEARAVFEKNGFIVLARRSSS
jgi:molybdate transport system substrate-binding protein